MDLDKKRKYFRDYYWKHKASGRHRFYSWRHNLIKKYGLTVEQYDALWIEQAGTCAICHTRENAKGRGVELEVDHDHATGQVRGLLCRPCNTGLGHFQDSPDQLKSAISYLDQLM